MSLEKSTRQTVSRQDMTQESATLRQMEAVLLKGMVDKDLEPTATKQDVATTLLARDYKGLNNFGTNGVIEWK
jgi:hypothetical protein